MLEHVPATLGAALKRIRPGLDKVVARRHFADVPATLTVRSGAFSDGDPMPADCSEDGRKISPPLTWTGVPGGCAEVVIMIEDADSPTPGPLVHAIVHGLPGQDGGLAEGALKSEGSPGEGYRLGRNSYMKAAFLPADPPRGHGPHRYAVQVFALDAPISAHPEPGRSAVVSAMQGHVMATGLLVGTYERR